MIKGIKKSDCKFNIKGVKRKDGWTFWVQNCTDNHPPEENLRGHLMARQMNATQSKLIITALNTGSTSRALAALLRATDLTFTASSQDTKNLKNKTKRELLGGRSPIDALFDSLRSSAHTSHYRLGNENEVSNFMIANPTSIALQHASVECHRHDSI
jgi:hypothetical protein